MKRCLAAGLASLAGALVACDAAGTPASPAPPAVSASPLPVATPVRLRAPAAAILDEAAVGLARNAARDHLGAAEAAGSEPDQVDALQVYYSWGWVEASTRSWAGGGRRVDDTVLLSVRAQGAQRAFVFWSGAAELAPFTGQPCPTSIAGLDQCRLGTGDGRSIVVGRLDAEVFRITATGLDAAALAAVQASRLAG